MIAAEKAADLAERGFQPIDTIEWESYKDEPSGFTYQRIKRRKTVEEVAQEIVRALGTDEHGYLAEPGLEEYFTVMEHGEWPDGQIAVFAVRGGSEGDYVHVEVLSGRHNQCLILGKTFQGRDSAWSAARRIADLLGA